MAPAKAETAPAKEVINEEEVEEEVPGDTGLVEGRGRGDHVPSSSSSSAAATITTSPLLPLKTVEDLCGLSGVLSEFVRQWNALQHTLGSIQAAIDAALLDSTSGVAQERDAEAEQGNDKAPHRSELEFICETMGSRPLRKYMAAHLSAPDRLRAEVPSALRRAPDPARLVLDAMGRFYLQGSKAYSYDSPAIPTRRACLLLLELFLLSGLSSSPDPSVAEDARVAILAWKGRLVHEGGVNSASTADALGLILFLASFGIPEGFSSRELSDLLQLCDLKEKANILHHSPILLAKLPDIIRDMMSKSMPVEAVNLVCAFGLEEKFPPLVFLSSFLSKCMQPAKQEQREGRYSYRSERTGDEKQLAVLKSIIKCVDDNKLDLSKLASFNINQKIAELEKAVAKGEQRLKGNNLKRKAEVGPLTKPEAHGRHPRNASSYASHWTTLQLNQPTQKQGSAVFSGVNSYYNGLLPQSEDDGVFSGPGVGGGGMGLVAVSVQGTGPSAAVYGGSLTNAREGVYGWHGDKALTEVSGGYNCNLLEIRPSGGQSATGPLMENSLMDPSQNAEQNLYWPQPVSPLGIGNGSSGSGLYQFADIVLEQESHHEQSLTSTATNNPGYHQ